MVCKEPEAEEQIQEISLERRPLEYQIGRQSIDVIVNYIHDSLYCVIWMGLITFAHTNYLRAYQGVKSLFYGRFTTKVIFRFIWKGGGQHLLHRSLTHNQPANHSPVSPAL